MRKMHLATFHPEVAPRCRNNHPATAVCHAAGMTLQSVRIQSSRASRLGSE